MSFSSDSDILVSVSCLSFNHELYIRKCLNGFVNQKCNFLFEVLIHDDASTDKTQEIIKEFQNKYPELIKPILQTENQYQKKNGSPTFNFNFPRAKGKYIALCEGDDYWTDPLKLQKQVDALEKNNNAAVAFHAVDVLDEENTIIKKNIFNLKNENIDSFELIHAKTYIPTNTLVFRNVIEEFPLAYFNVLNADTFLISLLGNFGNAIFLNDIKPSIYRVHSNGIWSKKNNLFKALNHKNTYFNLAAYYKSENKTDSFKYFMNKIQSETNPRIFFHALQSKDISLAFKYYFINCFTLLKKAKLKTIYINSKSLIKLFIS